MSKVVVIDYGIGNLLSVTRAFEAVGVEVQLTNQHRSIAAADRLVVPGVGAFGDGMRGLHQRDLVDPIREFTTKGRPFLGICLGMQLMLDESEEFGLHAGLGLIPGRIVQAPTVDPAGRPVKVPHIGWNALQPGQRNDWDGTILQGIPAGAACYFVHSFMAVPHDPAALLAKCTYSGYPITAVVAQNYLYGCQFHPEKSGTVGLKILENFIRL